MTDKPEIRLRPNTYQPGKKEMLEDVRIDATPDELADSVLKPVKLIRDDARKPN